MFQFQAKSKLKNVKINKENYNRIILKFTLEHGDISDEE